MSYITSTLRCDACGLEMNVAFGVVGHTVIASHPERCPRCADENLTHIAHGWQARDRLAHQPGQEPRRSEG